MADKIHKVKVTDPATGDVRTQSILLAKPGSLAARYDIITAVAENGRRGLMAALGLCWAGYPGSKYKSSGYNPLQFGGDVMDTLLEKGYDLNEITEVASAAFWLAADGLVSKSAVAEAEGNSEGQREE